MSSVFSLAGRVALVTGASRGLGAEIAVALRGGGADVAVHCNTRSPEATCTRIRAAGRRALPVAGDLAAMLCSLPPGPSAVTIAQRTGISLTSFTLLARLVHDPCHVRGASRPP
jgi:NAD(P)-dependent dehydrogenase (short-subunit alcohol dehydrogenase family)